MRASSLFAFALLSSLAIQAEEIEKLSLKPPPGLQRADVCSLKTKWTPRAVLVLCPGCNGNGEGLIRQREWQEFAREHQLGLAGLSFASITTVQENRTSYYHASKGSGQALLEAIRKIYGKDLPVLLFGFSGGAHFTSRFVEWKPERVIAWCAYSAGWWDIPLKTAVNPPGIVACGDADPRYGESMIYFKQGRVAGKPWLWISLARVGHSGSPPLEAFIRQYFAAVLKHNQRAGLWVDVDLETPASGSERKEEPSLTGWIPDIGLLDRWKAINEP